MYSEIRCVRDESGGTWCNRQKGADRRAEHDGNHSTPAVSTDTGSMWLRRLLKTQHASSLSGYTQSLRVVVFLHKALQSETQQQ